MTTEQRKLPARLNAAKAQERCQAIMTASRTTVTGYDDTQALNDIHARPTPPARPAPAAAPRDIASILACPSRPPWPSRITAAADDAHGAPAGIGADAARAFIHPNGPAILIRFTPRDQVCAEAPVISVAGTVTRQPRPPRARP